MPGTRICVIKRGRIPASINEMHEKMTNDDVSVLTALEDVIRIPTHDEEWQLLENVIGKDNADRIRNDLD